ncbi:MAG TPA: tRNA (adenosine(37)-N6)-dimethylallyltransferase MiaA [Lachnospiraceae bacterium]|nr:tRNA (adenosine(37)-N6)-dimethylallyltransferase MiaA [Lachnospiraceae bacterium]
MEKKSLVILTGPTAVGKTALSLALARQIGGEIVSADSMQIYKYMDIGSAKISREEMAGISHHLIDVLDPREPFSVVAFQQMARAAMEGIYGRGHIPILVGGTGFYIQAVVRDITFTESEDDPAFRAACDALVQKEGPEALHNKLKKIDPASAEAIHPHNSKRVTRALEYYHLTGQPISAHNMEQQQKESPYAFAYFVLNDKREKLYEQIDRRVERMLAAGLLDEVRRLSAMGCSRRHISMQGLGYKELLDYLDGKIRYEEAVYQIKRDTRHFAKRQITWFKRERDVIWINKDDFGYDDQQMLTFMIQTMAKRGIHYPVS